MHWLDSEADVDLEVLQFPHPETSANRVVLVGSVGRELKHPINSEGFQLKEWITFKSVYISYTSLIRRLPPPRYKRGLLVCEWCFVSIILSS